MKVTRNGLSTLRDSISEAPTKFDYNLTFEVPDAMKNTNKGNIPHETKLKLQTPVVLLLSVRTPSNPKVV